MMSFQKILCALAVLASWQSAQASAPLTTPTIPFNSLADSNSQYRPIGPNNFWATAVAAGANATSISNVTAMVFGTNTSAPLVVRVCADNAGVPNLSSCQTFTPDSGTIPTTFVNASFSGAYAVAANAKVWIVLSASGSASYTVGLSTVANHPLLFSNSAGNTWVSGGVAAELLLSVSNAPANSAPKANAVAISGTPQVGKVLTGSYTYADADGDVQGNTTVRWMSSSTADGSNKTAISGATTASYSPVAADGGNYLFYCVTPVAQTGVIAGTETCSSGSQLVLVSPITTPTTATGIGPNQVLPLDMSTGYGPSLTQCLMATLQQLLGADAVYLGQVSGGASRVQQGGKVISFYVVRAAGDASAGSGLRLLQSNALNLGTSCGNLDLAPALYNPAEFGAVLTAAGLSASINTQGVITITGNGSVYVARPDYFVTPGQGAGPSLKLGSDGQYRFTDSAGNSQVLRPAFLSPDTLQADAGAALGGNLVIQIDGTALFTQFSGPQSVLSPDLVLGGIPASAATTTWWADGPNHYRFPIGFASQGLTQSAK